METLNTLLTILIPLLIIMDPLGNLLFFLLFTKQNTPAEKGRMAVITSVAACLILFFFAFTGDSVLHYFGIGLPAFQVAGGFIFFVYALQMLHLIPSGLKTTIEEEEEGITKTNAALVPMATPMLAGPGAITAVLVWKLNPDNPVNTPLLLIGTKSDLEHSRFIKREEIEELIEKHNIFNFLKTSAKTGNNVNKVFDILTNKILECMKK